MALSVWFCPLLRAGRTGGAAPWEGTKCLRDLHMSTRESAIVPWFLSSSSPAHGLESSGYQCQTHQCTLSSVEFPSLFPLLEEQGYQRGLAMGGSVCPKSEFCDFQALTFQYLSAWRHSPGRCTAPGSVWVDTAVIPLIFLQFWFYLVQPHRVSRGVGKTCADPIPAPISSSPSFRIMHDEVSETENIRKNLAIERMIIEGCEILLDTSQTFVRQGLCRRQRPSPLR